MCGSDRRVGVVKHLHFDADEIRFAGADAVRQVDVGQRHASDRGGGRACGKGIEAGRCAQGGHIVAWGDLDEVNGRHGCRGGLLRIDVGVADPPVAVADQIAERVGRRFRAAVFVGDRAAVEVGLGERRTNAEQRAATQQLAVDRRSHDPILALYR